MVKLWKIFASVFSFVIVAVLTIFKILKLFLSIIFRLIIPQTKYYFSQCAYKKTSDEYGWNFERKFFKTEKETQKYWENKKQIGEIYDYNLIIDNFKCENNSTLNPYPSFYDWFDKNWSYSIETKKLYSSDEIMPEPKLNNQVCENLKVSLIVNPDLLEENETPDQYDKENLKDYIEQKETRKDNTGSYLICIKFENGNQSCFFDFDYGINKVKLYNFINEISNNNYINLYNNELPECFLHLFKKDDKVHIYIQKANGNYELESVFDYIAPKCLFLEKMNKLTDEIELKIKTAEIEYR